MSHAKKISSGHAAVATPKGESAADRVRKTLSRLGPAVVRPGALFELLGVSPRDPEGVIRVIQRCPSLSARVIARVNSASSGMSHHVDSIRRAVLLLGAPRARMVALAHGLRIMHEATGLPPRVVDTLWSATIDKACAARRFCESADPQHADHAYCVGLIQDIGLPMLVAVEPDFYEGDILATRSADEWLAAERDRFGFDHAAIGQGLLLEWNASSQLQRSVLNHHRPATVPPEDEREAIPSLASFVASLLPHAREPLTSAANEWLSAIHARFLAHEHASPQAFLDAAAEDARKCRAAETNAVPTDPAQQAVAVRKLVCEVAVNTVRLVGKVHRLEHTIEHVRAGAKELSFQAFTDPLTRTLNRRGFMEISQRRLEMSARQGMGVCCMLSDMDDFKKINDKYGHEAGDQVLRGLCRLLRRALGPQDLVGRLGGDEFAVFIAETTEGDALARAEAIISAMSGKRMRLRPGLDINASLSLGAVYAQPEEGTLTIDALLRAADATMYERKRQGKAGLVFAHYDPSLTPDASRPQDPPHLRTRGTPRR